MENYSILKLSLSKNKAKIINIFLTNFTLLFLQTFGAVLSIKAFSYSAFLYYTNLSNYFSLIVCIIVCFASIKSLKKDSELKPFYYSIRFIANVCLMITFFVCFCLLIPLKPDILAYMVNKDANLLYHIICPIFSIISFIIIEEYNHSKRLIFIATIPTMIYGIIISILNLLGVIVGPYPFFAFSIYPLSFCIPLVFGIYFLSLLISYILYLIKRKKV